MGQLSDTPSRLLPQFLGNVTPENPPATDMFCVCEQFLHWTWTKVDFDESTEAPMTIPGTLTRRDIFIAFRSRIESSAALE